MPFYPAANRDVHLGPASCRCCPDGASRSNRARGYPSDMSEAEWAVCEPLLPAPAWLAGRGGRSASHCMRDIVDAIRYLTHNGPAWRALPGDFPPAGTVYGGWINGRRADPLSGCTMTCVSASGWPPGARRPRRPRSSIPSR